MASTASEGGDTGEARTERALHGLLTLTAHIHSTYAPEIAFARANGYDVPDHVLQLIDLVEKVHNVQKVDERRGESTVTAPTSLATSLPGNSGITASTPETTDHRVDDLPKALVVAVDGVTTAVGVDETAAIRVAVQSGSTLSDPTITEDEISDDGGSAGVVAANRDGVDMEQSSDPTVRPSSLPRNEEKPAPSGTHDRGYVSHLSKSIGRPTSAQPAMAAPGVELLQVTASPTVKGTVGTGKLLLLPGTQAAVQRHRELHKIALPAFVAARKEFDLRRQGPKKQRQWEKSTANPEDLHELEEDEVEELEEDCTSNDSDTEAGIATGDVESSDAKETEVANIPENVGTLDEEPAAASAAPPFDPQKALTAARANLKKRKTDVPDPEDVNITHPPNPRPRGARPVHEEQVRGLKAGKLHSVPISKPPITPPQVAHQARANILFASDFENARHATHEITLPRQDNRSHEAETDVFPALAEVDDVDDIAGRAMSAPKAGADQEPQHDRASSASAHVGFLDEDFIDVGTFQTLAVESLHCDPVIWPESVLDDDGGLRFKLFEIKRLKERACVFEYQGRWYLIACPGCNATARENGRFIGNLKILWAHVEKCKPALAATGKPRTEKAFFEMCVPLKRAYPDDEVKAIAENASLLPSRKIGESAFSPRALATLARIGNVSTFERPPGSAADETDLTSDSDAETGTKVRVCSPHAYRGQVLVKAPAEFDLPYTFSTSTLDGVAYPTVYLNACSAVIRISGRAARIMACLHCRSTVNEHGEYFQNVYGLLKHIERTHPAVWEQWKYREYDCLMECTKTLLTDDELWALAKLRIVIHSVLEEKKPARSKAIAEDVFTNRSDGKKRRRAANLYQDEVEQTEAAESTMPRTTKRIKA